MASPLPIEQVYDDKESIGMAVIATCGVLSLISVLGMFIILGMSAIRSRRHSPAEKPFVRTHIGMYFFSLLICNLAQALGAILNIPWIVEKRIYLGTVCAAQATIQQIGGVGTAIFSFLIAAHTFSLLFLRRQWSDRTSYITLIVSWGILALDTCIGEFLARGAYYGITDYWCWITPTYPIERYVTVYLFMFASVGLSFILYLLVFFRLRGNITVSAGYKVHSHRRPKARVGRTNTGAYIVTDDRRVESHLTTVATRMLWHPIAYTVLVLPFAVARCSTFSGASVPFLVTTSVTAIFVLGGFVNAVLFCTTRNVLPERWRQRLRPSTTSDGTRSITSLPSRSFSTRWRAESGVGIGVARTGMAPVILDISVEKNVEIRYDEGDRSPSSLTFSSPPSPTRPLRAYGGRQRADIKSHHTRPLSFSPLRNETLSLHSGVDGDSEDRDLGGGMRPASKVKRIIEEVPDQLVHASKEHGGGIYGLAPDLEAVDSFHPFDTASLVSTNTRQDRPISILTFETAVHHASTHIRWANGDLGGDGHKSPPSPTQQMGVYSPAISRHPYSVPRPGTESRRPGY